MIATGTKFPANLMIQDPNRHTTHQDTTRKKLSQSFPEVHVNSPNTTFSPWIRGPAWASARTICGGVESSRLVVESGTAGVVPGGCDPDGNCARIVDFASDFDGAGMFGVGGGRVFGKLVKLCLVTS
jgi:hypothetical protein